MDNPRPEKVAVVEEVRHRLDEADGALLTEYRGIDVAGMAELRASLREAGGEYKVYKNTLVRFAARELGLEIEEYLEGPTAIAFARPGPDGSAGDPARVAKALKEFQKKNAALVVKAGVLGGNVLDASQARALADLPSRENLLAEFLGAAESLYQDFAGLLDAKLREFSYALQEALDERPDDGSGASDPGTPIAEAATETDEAPTAEPETDEPAAEAADAATETDEAPTAEPADESKTEES